MRRRRPALPAFIAVLLVVGQLAAFAHRAAEQHVECAEHGEELEAATLAETLHACTDDHLVAVEGEEGEHDECALARALHQSSTTPGTWIAPALPALELVPRVVAVELAPVVTSLYRLAPKTSPPV